MALLDLGHPPFSQCRIPRPVVAEDETYEPGSYDDAYDGTEDAAERERRLATARLELAAEAEFDVTIVNASVREAADQLVKLIRSPSISGKS